MTTTMEADQEVPRALAPASPSDSRREPPPRSATSETPTAMDHGSRSPVASEADSATSVTITYKRKKRRSAVTEAEDVAILRAVARIQPLRPPRSSMKQRWQQVADAVIADTGTDVEVTRMLCQRRYDILLNRFVMQRELQNDWPQNPKMRRLLEAAVAERKANVVATSPTARLSLDAFRTALAGAKDGKVTLGASFIGKTETLEHTSDSRVVQALPSDVSNAESDDVIQRRSFVHSTVVAVMDRLVEMEKTWLEKSREERKHTQQPDNKELVTMDTTKPTETVSGNGENQTNGANPVPPIDHVRSQEIEAFKTELAVLTEAINTSQEADQQLAEQVATLSFVLEGVRKEKDVLKEEVATLQAMLRDAASLAGTLRLLRAAHKQHMEQFEAYVAQQDVELKALRQEIHDRLQVILQVAAGAKSHVDMDLLIQQERARLHDMHRERMAEVDAKIAQITELEVIVRKQQQGNQAEAQVTKRSTGETLSAVTNAIETGRPDDHNSEASR